MKILAKNLKFSKQKTFGRQSKFQANIPTSDWSTGFFQKNLSMEYVKNLKV